MTSRTPAWLLAVPAAAVLALTGCGGGDATTTSSTATTTTTASTAPEASSAPSATESASSAPAGDKAYTEAELAAMLKGVQVGGKTLQVATPKNLETVKKSVFSNQVVQFMQQATVTPAQCKTVTLEAAKLATARVPLAAGFNSGTPMVLLRSMKSAADAKAVMDANRKTAEACANYTMSMAQAGGRKVSLKGTSQVVDIAAPSADGTTGQRSGVEANGQKSATTTALGTVGNLLVQVTDNSGKSTPAQLSKDVEAVAKSVAANR